MKRVALAVVIVLAVTALIVAIRYDGAHHADALTEGGVGDASVQTAKAAAIPNGVSYDDLCCCPTGLPAPGSFQPPINQGPNQACAQSAGKPYSCTYDTWYCYGGGTALCSYAPCPLYAGCQIKDLGCYGLVDTCTDECAILDIPILGLALTGDAGDEILVTFGAPGPGYPDGSLVFFAGMTDGLSFLNGAHTLAKFSPTTYTFTCACGGSLAKYQGGGYSIFRFAPGDGGTFLDAGDGGGDGGPIVCSGGCIVDPIDCPISGCINNSGSACCP